MASATEEPVPPEEASSWSKGSTVGSTLVGAGTSGLLDEVSDELETSSGSPDEEDGEEEVDETTDLSHLLHQEAGDAVAGDGDAELDLPSTVTVLPGPEGGKVYLVGTAHFSTQSNEDVALTIQRTQPNVVVLELCESRLSILALDEETILRESQNLSLDQVRSNIEKQGLVQGVMYTLLLSLSAQLTRELGMAPGGEFRRAFAEARKIPGCVTQLGDRPVHLTLRRAISSLTLWQKVKLGFSILCSSETVTKEEVEKCKQRDLLESMLGEIRGEYPSLSHVLVQERDLFLAYSLQLAATPRLDVRDPQRRLPTTVVGVVGIGHTGGIIANWGKVRDEDIPPLMSVPPPSLTSLILLKSAKYSAVSLIAYGCYRFLLPKSVKSLAGSSARYLLASAAGLVHPSPAS